MPKIWVGRLTLNGEKNGGGLWLKKKMSVPMNLNSLSLSFTLGDVFHLMSEK